MAGVKGKSGSRSFEDRELSGRVRSLALGEIEKVLLGKGKYKDDEDFKKAILLKMSNSLLPRLNAGRDENERLIPQPLLGGQSINESSNDNSDKETTETEEED